MLRKPLHKISMYRPVTVSLQVIVACVVLLLTISTKLASSANARTSLSFDEKSINGVDAYAWAPKGNELVYAMSDGSLWFANGPNFARPIRIIKIALAKEQKIEQIVWSADGQHIAIVAPRLTDLWDTVWLVNIKTSELRDLLPLGAPFGGPGRRALRISSWLPDGRITFVQHCGTGCLGLHAVQTQRNEGYWDFCDASGSFFWSATRKDAVVQNDAEGIGLRGLGLVWASTGVAVAKGASYYRPRRECKSILVECTQPKCQPPLSVPQFNSWFPDSTIVLYTDATSNGGQLELWNTLSGLRRTVATNGSSGAVSPDGRYVSFISSKRETDNIPRSNRVSLAIMDLRNEKIIGSSEVPALRSPPLWSPSMSYLAGITKNEKLAVAHLSSDGVKARQTGIAVQDLSWSPDGKYLAVWESISGLKVLKFPSDAKPSTDTTPGMSRE